MHTYCTQHMTYSKKDGIIVQGELLIIRIIRVKGEGAHELVESVVGRVTLHFTCTHKSTTVAYDSTSIELPLHLYIATCRYRCTVLYL